MLYNDHAFNNKDIWKLIEIDMFDQAGCEHDGTLLKYNRREFVRTVSLLRVKARKGITYILITSKSDGG